MNTQYSARLRLFKAVVIHGYAINYVSAQMLLVPHTGDDSQRFHIRQHNIQLDDVYSKQRYIDLKLILCFTQTLRVPHTGEGNIRVYWR